ncbi:BCNT-domain-containing protein [Aspergillus steynii IBT 23096]|uniref:SWR1-complex protein 5 n=1 Tax=Aspergillus steynii IBT 23096 TaxID=1392250 RepID=A0A2I2FVD8_9EURO|nr:BCNT-domain-containing protein [Aspergillus steynii IBT 23096]PLB44609.1 BCNT-domain-containing protein [Aspergillus steynii IBT 23096]
MSADPTTVPDLDVEDEQYDSEEDEDFQLDDAAGGQEDEDGLSSSDSDEEAGAGEPANKKRKTGKRQNADDEELGSGDEATIQKAKAKKSKGKKQKKSKEGGGAKGDDDEDDEDDVDFDDDEEGGPGGFVRTRAMKMRTQEERKPLAKIDGATVDVDALWAKMNAPDTDSGPDPSENETQETKPAADGETNKTETQEAQEPPTTQQKPKYTEELVKIKRTYKFAGEMITEEKLVPKDSAEAKIYLASGNDAETVPVADADAERANVKAALNLRRPLRRLSRFDPNPTGSIKKSWEKQPAAAQAPGTEEGARGPKINTVEKSRLDWAAYVDQAGIKDELKVHSKAKEGFLGRMDFLDRVGANREEEMRNARLKRM